MFNFNGNRMTKNEKRFWERIYNTWGDKYNYSQTVYKPDNEYINVICRKHGLFTINCGNFKNKHGCKVCDNENKSYTNDKFLKDVNIIKGDWYEPITEAHGVEKQKVIILCKTCGNLFSTTPRNFLKSKSCPYCKPRKLTEENFIKRIDDIYHGSLKYIKGFKNVRSKVVMKCECGAEIIKSAEHFLLGVQCPYCSTASNKPLTQNDFIQRAKEIHGDKYDYSLVEYNGLYNNVKIKCNICNRVFYQKPLYHIYYSSGCSCRSSKGEEKIAALLDQYKINYIRQHKFKDLKTGERLSSCLKLDFYLPDKNLVIEFNGAQHYEAVDIWGGEEDFKLRQKYDQMKKDYCKKNGISFVEIPYWNFEKMEEIIVHLLNDC